MGFAKTTASWLSVLGGESKSVKLDVDALDTMDAMERGFVRSLAREEVKPEKAQAPTRKMTVERSEHRLCHVLYNEDLERVLEARVTAQGEVENVQVNPTVQAYAVLEKKDAFALSPSESQETKEEKKQRLKDMVAAFAKDVRKGISCTQFVVVDGVSMMKKRVVLSMDTLETVNLGTERSALLHTIPLSKAKVFDYNQLLSLRPDNVALKLVKDEDRALSIAIYHGQELIIIIVDDPQSAERILKGLRVLAARAKHVGESVLTSIAA